MKMFKKLVSLLAAAAIVVTPLSTISLKAEAATPTTYYIMYDVDLHDWRMQINEWKNDYTGREVYYLNEGSEKVKDGDIVVVLANEENETASQIIDINAHLSNLTVNRATVMLNVKGGIDECYVLGDSYAAITGNITNAYVYDNASTTLHSNITNLRLIATQENEVEATVTVGGTVKYASTSNAGGILKEYYNFKAGTFSYDFASGLMTDPENYSTTGNGPAAAPAPSTSNNTNKNNSKPANNNGYDNVPKTGESNAILWVFAAAFACLGSSVLLKRRAQN